MNDIDLLEQGLKIYSEILESNITPRLTPPPNYSGLRLTEVLRRCEYVPRQTTILGLCEDGYPLMFDLTDFRPGSILITGEAASFNRELLKMIVRTGCLYNQSDDFSFSVITYSPEAWEKLLSESEIQPHLLNIFPSWDEKACEWIIHEAERAEQRHMGRHNGPPRLLLIDEFEQITKMDFDVQRNLDWLMQYGPEVKVWPVAAIKSEHLRSISNWLALFKTWLVGGLTAEDRFWLEDNLKIYAPASKNDNEFAISLQNRWLSFEVPTLE